MTVLYKVKKTIERHCMLEYGHRVIVAVSGGPDSMALLRVLLILSRDYNLDLIMAHLNHKIRGNQAQRDERFVREMAERFRIPIECACSDIPVLSKERRTSIEDTARTERYRFLKDVSARCGAQRIAVGHQRGDQAETMFMNFLRGSGLTGLKGIAPMREGKIIRPLIDCTRTEITEFLAKEGIPFVKDESNEEMLYLRNRIRREVFPRLKEEYNPNMEEGLAHTAEILRLEDDYMESVVMDIVKKWHLDEIGGEARFSISEFVKLHEALQRRAIRMFLKALSPPGRGGRVAFTHVEAVRSLAKGENTHGSINLPTHISARRMHDDLIISRARETSSGRPSRAGAGGFRYEVKIPGRVDITEIGVAIVFSVKTAAPVDRRSFGMERIVCMDYDSLIPPLEIRNMQPGDRIQPIGMAGTKKVGDYFIDCKIPHELRSRIPLLVDRHSVVWIAGLRLSERVRITERTSMVARVEMI